MLTTEQLAKITGEALAGIPDSIGTPESKKMRAAIEADIAKIVAASGTVDLPNEIPDLDEAPPK